MKLSLLSVVLAVSCLGACTQETASAAPVCENLMSLKMPDTTITGATQTASGFFTPASEQGAEVAAGLKSIELPAFCRVQLTVSPAVRIEVWMPVSDWNGNFEGVGGGGMAGVISYPAMGTALKAGYATASTDTGHQGNTSDFALGRSGKDRVIQDFAYLAIHEMTVKAKQIIAAYYGAGVKEAYFNGCSQGGRQAFTEAERYPEDYDGILAGSPAINFANMMIAHIAVAVATLRDKDSYVPPSKLEAIQSASVAACDTLDGLEDGLVSEPRKCNFDPSVLFCKGPDSDRCLTAKQVGTVKNIYANIQFSDGTVVYPGPLPGAEKNWRNATTGVAPYKGSQYRSGVAFMQNFVFNDPKWDFRTWNYQEDIRRVLNMKMRELLDSSDPDLKLFRDHGGRLITYQGWGDDIVSPINTINYYKMVVAKLTGIGRGTDAYTPETDEFNHAAAKTAEFFRLFMFAGMGHCGGGSGPNVFDGMGALTNWVENKQPPDQIIASHLTNGSVDRTRPVCPYPMEAAYSGQGSIDDAANFACKFPK